LKPNVEGHNRYKEPLKEGFSKLKGNIRGDQGITDTLAR
jgi:hypothetical protein